MTADIINLAKQLISIPSNKENKKALGQVLALAKQQLRTFTIESFEKNGIPSLLAYVGKSRPKHS